MATFSSRKSQGPSKDAIMKYMEKKKAEQEVEKEKRFKDLLNPYRALKKDKEPDEDFLKAQKKRERLLKKKEKLIAEKVAQETARREAELERRRREDDDRRKAELREKERLKQERLRKIASVGHGKPKDRKMKEYLEKIRLAKEADRKKQIEEERKEEEKRKAEERALRKILLDEALEKRRASLGISTSSNSHNNNSKLRPNNNKSRPSVTSTAPQNPRSRVDEYSPTRPGIISKTSSVNKKPVEEYVPTKVSNKNGSGRESLRPDRQPSGYRPSKVVCHDQPPSRKLNAPRKDQSVFKNSNGCSSSNGIKKVLNSSEKQPSGVYDGSDDELDSGIEKEREKIRRLEEELKKAKEIERRKLEAKEQARAKARVQAPPSTKIPPPIPSRSGNRPIPTNRIIPIGLSYRRNANRRKYEDYDDDEEEDEDMKDFIDDGDGYDDSKETISECIKEIFGYDKKKYAYMDDDDIEESSFAQQMKEERASARAGYLEDLEDVRKEKEERARKERLKKTMKIIDSSEEED